MPISILFTVRIGFLSEKKHILEITKANHDAVDTLHRDDILGVLNTQDGLDLCNANYMLVRERCNGLFGDKLLLFLDG